jgi:hypothetical protein
MDAGVPTWSSESTAGRLVSHQSISGAANNPTSTPGFITPVCTLTVTGVQTVFVTSSITLYGYAPPPTAIDGASLSLIIKPAGVGFNQILSESYVSFPTLTDRRRITFHGSKQLFSGTYYIGIEGYRDPYSSGTVIGVSANHTVLVFNN